MTKLRAPALAILFFVSLFAASAFATPAPSDCTALNAARGEGKLTGQISSAPDGSSMEVTYGGQTVVVHYTNSVTVCQGGRPGSVNALAQGASVSVFGPMRRNGTSMEIDAARIFVAEPPQAVPSNPASPLPSSPPQPQTTRPNPEPPLRNLQQEPTRITGSSSNPGSVILRGGTHAETMQRLRVVRTYAFSDLQTHPQITLGEKQLNFRPMLDNPKALFNLAQRLRGIPQYVELRENTSEITEVDQGLVIHHILTYRILPGKCADADARARLERAGIGCFSRASVSERIAEFSQPDSPRYVADPEKRQKSIAAYQRNRAFADAEATRHIAELRKALTDPAQQAAIGAQVGQTETARMDGLTDDQLKEELINSGVQHFEETMFVPKGESSQYAHPQHILNINLSSSEIAAVQQILRNGAPVSGGVPGFPKLLKVVPGTALHLGGAPAGDREADLDLGPYIFLTGFTFSQDKEWSWSAGITINWCIVDCASTYGIELHAGFNYGFGLRFPIEAKLKYHTVVHPNSSAQATLNANFQPIKGTVDDFFAAGISADQLFNAQELVAQVGGDAGFNLNLPGLSVGPDLKIGVDFTQSLPSPFTGGSFPPPAPGGPGITSQPVYPDIDLLGGLLDYGVAGGKLLPALKINLHSDKLQFTLNDEVQRRQSVLTSSQTAPVAIEPDTGGDDSRFTLGNPVYNLGFTLTPGLAPTLFIDIDVWSQQWSWPIWFPELAVTIPSNGIDFACHAGTTCFMDFRPTFNASTGQVHDTAGETDVADRTLTGGGCQRLGSRSPGEGGHYLCPVKGMLGLCQTVLNNGAVSSCGPLIPATIDKALRYQNKCTGSDGNYVCQTDMIGLCNLYLKNQEILSCKRAP